jgi:hypothetical protein
MVALLPECDVLAVMEMWQVCGSFSAPQRTGPAILVSGAIGAGFPGETYPSQFSAARRGRRDNAALHR